MVKVYGLGLALGLWFKGKVWYISTRAAESEVKLSTHFPIGSVYFAAKMPAATGLAETK